MSTLKSARPAERQRWAVCQEPKAHEHKPMRFHHEDDARRFQDKIVIPATILGDEEILPPDPECAKVSHTPPISWVSTNGQPPEVPPPSESPFSGERRRR